MSRTSLTTKLNTGSRSVHSSSVRSLNLPARQVKASRTRSVVVRAEDNIGASVSTESAPADIPKTEGFSELMAFAGPLPERVNGRLAMLGFVAAAGAELTTGQTTLTQFANHPFAVSFHWALFAAASAAPAVMSGNSLKVIMEAAKEKGMADGLQKFNADVELLNGRAAMIGCLLLLGIEGMKGSALF